EAKCWAIERTATSARFAMSTAVGSMRPSSSSVGSAPTIAARVRFDLSRRPSTLSAATAPVSTRSRSRLHELERQPVALADGLVLGVVHVAQLVGRRQRPDALGIVLGVFRVRVDL